MRRMLSFAVPLTVSCLLLAGIVTAQTGAPDSGPTPAPTAGTAPEMAPRTTPTLIPEIQAGAYPMDRQPDPASGSAAAEAPPQRGDAVPQDTECAVRRADSDTGFVVVCE